VIGSRALGGLEDWFRLRSVGVGGVHLRGGGCSTVVEVLDW